MADGVWGGVVECGTEMRDLWQMEYGGEVVVADGVWGGGSCGVWCGNGGFVADGVWGE